MLQDLRESLDSGRELTTAMRRHPKIFSPFYLSMVQVGEMTGMLDQTFMRLYEHLEFENDMRERIKSAMRYPMFVIIAMVIAIVIINIFVIPAFAKVFEGFHTELPLMTRILMGFSRFHGGLLADPAGAGDWWRVRVPLLRSTRRWDATTGTDTNSSLPDRRQHHMKATLARFARSFGVVVQERYSHRAGD